MCQRPLLLWAIEVECICGFEQCSPLFGGHNLCGFGNCITVCFVVRKIEMARNLSSWVPQRWGHVNYPLKFHRSEVTWPLILRATVVSVASYLVSHKRKILPFIRRFQICSRSSSKKLCNWLKCVQYSPGWCIWFSSVSPMVSCAKYFIVLNPSEGVNLS